MKTKRITVFFITALMLVLCLSASVFAEDATNHRTVITYDKNTQSVKLDIYLSGGTAIVGYCNFDYDSSSLILLDKNLSPVPEDIPELSSDGTSSYLTDVVSMGDVDIVITDVKKGVQNLINTKDGRISFAWYLPSTVPNIDATSSDILFASIRFSAKENAVITENCIKVASYDATEHIDSWSPGLAVMSSGKTQYSYVGNNSDNSSYTSTFKVIENADESEPENTESSKSDDITEKPEDSTEEDTAEKPESSDDKTQESAPDSDVKQETEDIPEEETEAEKDDSDSAGKEEAFPDGFQNPDENEKTESEDNKSSCPYENTPSEAKPAYAENVSFSLEVTADTESIRIKWSKPSEIQSVSSYNIMICDSSFDIVKRITGISPVTSSYTANNLYGGTDYKLYILATGDGKAFTSELYNLTTKEYEGYPPVVSFKVKYDKNGVYLYGFSEEDVLYGGTVSKTPTVIPKNEKLFIGWSKDGKTVIDLNSEKIYSDTVFYPVLSDKEPAPYPAYITGYSDGTFKPSGNITRAETATLISRISDKYSKDSRYCHTFTDCKAGMWYEKAIAFCSSYGYMKGYDDGTFKPDSNITRAEFATILVRVFGLYDITGMNVFSDISNHWGRDFICALYSAGIVVPDSDGKFRPDEKLTREEAVRMLNACLGIHPDKNHIDETIKNEGYKFSDVPHYSDYYYDIMAATLG